MILDSNGWSAKHLTGKEARDARGWAARIADVERVAASRETPLIGFKWDKRHDAVYLGKFARQIKMPFSRLTKAVEFLDYQFRVTRNFYASKKRRDQGKICKK